MSSNGYADVLWDGCTESESDLLEHVQYEGKRKRETEGGRTFAARTIKEWNAIDTSTRALESVNSFKYNLKKTFLTQQKAAMHLFL